MVVYKMAYFPLPEILCRQFVQAGPCLPQLPFLLPANSTDLGFCFHSSSSNTRRVKGL